MILQTYREASDREKDLKSSLSQANFPTMIFWSEQKESISWTYVSSVQGRGRYSHPPSLSLSKTEPIIPSRTVSLKSRQVARGKPGNGYAGWMPEGQKHTTCPSMMVEAPLRRLLVLGPWQRRAGSQKQGAGLSYLGWVLLPYRTATPLMACE